MQCPECKATEIVKAGMAWQARKKVQRWRCLQCGRIFIEPSGEPGKEKRGQHASGG